MLKFELFSYLSFSENPKQGFLGENGGREEALAWPMVMDHVLEGGRRVFEFLSELVYTKQSNFIRVRHGSISSSYKMR